MQIANAPWSIKAGPNAFQVRDNADRRVLSVANEQMAQWQIANLAAAAPEMRDALRAAECCVEQLCQGQDPANQCWVTLAEIRAAIAKAEGR